MPKKMTFAEQELFDRHLNSLSKEHEKKEKIAEKSTEDLIIDEEENKYDIESNVTSEMRLKFKRNCLSEKNFRELEQGKYKAEASLDLHGIYEKDATEELYNFIKTQYNLNAKVIKIIHGKAANKDNPPVIKNMVNKNLSKISQVLAFCSARSYDGGTGAVYVFLKAKRR
ncbi:MAG: Smr/MutS family protein [Pseudomonadota bacterium]|nr:Smr/MutS family protein [Pseudomonadota bacterium]